MRTRFAFSILLLGVATVACGQTVSLDDRPCPCASGYTCCSAQNMCVAEGTACPGGSGGGEQQPPGTPPSTKPVVSNDPVVLAHAQSARCITTYKDRVYWENADGLLVSMRSDGGDQQIGTLQTPTADNPKCGIVVQDDIVWRTSYALGQIVREGIPHSETWGTVSFSGNVTTPSSLAIDSEYLYVTEHTTGFVSRLAHDGTPLSVVAYNLVRPDRVVVDGSNIYWIELGTSGAKDGAVKMAYKSGGDPITLAKNLEGPVDLARAGDNLYYSTQDGVFAINLASPTVFKSSTVFAESLGVTGPVVTDDKNVFWSDLDGIHRQAFASPGGELIDKKSVVLALAVDDLRVYWTDGESVTSVGKFR